MNSTNCDSPASKQSNLKNYEVLVVGYATAIVVGAEDSNQAEELAIDAICKGDFDVGEAKAEREIVDENDLARSKKRAGCVVDDD